MATNETVSQQSVTSQLLQSDPEIRSLVNQKLDARIASAKAELAQLEAERAQSGETSDPARRGPGRPKGSGKASNGAARKVGRPSGPGPDHVGAIFGVVTGKKGVSAKDIVETLVKRTKPSDGDAYGKTIRTYLSKMANESDGRLVVTGEPGSKVYSRGPNAPK